MALTTILAFLGGGAAVLGFVYKVVEAVYHTRIETSNEPFWARFRRD